jgi:DNA-binding transcriptional MerR regulator
MKDLKPVPEVAKAVNASTDQIRYWCSLLGVKPTRKGRVSFLTLIIVAQIEMMARFIAAGMSPKEAAVKTKEEKHELPEETQVMIPTDHDKRFESMEKAILTMADQMKSLSEQVKSLTLENRALRHQLTPSTQKTKVIVWHPEPIQRPAYPWYKQLWYELTAPQMLRAEP